MPPRPVPPSFVTGGLGWHNWKLAGWKTIGSAPYLICKMWGPSYGDEGFVYMDRKLANAVLIVAIGMGAQSTRLR